MPLVLVLLTNLCQCMYCVLICLWTNNCVRIYFSRCTVEYVCSFFLFKICGRTFVSERLATHVAACQAASKERPVFDVAMARIAGTEAAELVQAGR